MSFLEELFEDFGREKSKKAKNDTHENITIGGRCPNCSSLYPTDSKFCPKCGKKIEEENAEKIKMI